MASVARARPPVAPLPWWALVGGAFPAAGIAIGFAVTDLTRVLIPTWWDLAATLWACTALGIADGVSSTWRTRRPVALAALLGSGFGVSVTYAVLCGPLLVIGVLTALVGIGLVALAPYWNFLGYLRVLRRLRGGWGPPGMSWRTACFWGAVCAYPATILWRAAESERVHTVLAATRPIGASSPAVESFSDHRITALSEAQLLASCYVNAPAMTWPRTAVADWLTPPRLRRAPPASAQLSREAYFRGYGRPFWLEPVPRPVPTEALAGSEGSFRFGGNQTGVLAPTDAAGAIDARRGPLPDLELRSSALYVRPNGTARWLLQVGNRGVAPRQCRVQLGLPPGAFVVDAQLQVNGQWRRAAFGPDPCVTTAYEEVANVVEDDGWRGRDPLLARVVGPGRVRAVMFPVPARRAAQFSFDMVLPARERVVGSPVLSLPTLIDRDARWTTSHHLLWDGEVVRRMGARDVRDAVRSVLELEAEVAPAVVVAAGRRWPSPGRAPALVLDGFFGVGRAIGSAVGEGLPPATPCRVLANHATLSAFPAQLGAVSRDVAFVGPHQRGAQMAAAVTDLLDQATGPVDLLWVHTASTLELPDHGVIHRLARRLRDAESQVIALPARTDQTPNTMVEALVGEGVAVAVHRTRATLAGELARLRQGRGLATPVTAAALDVPLGEVETDATAPEDWPVDRVVRLQRIFQRIGALRAAGREAEADVLAEEHRILTPGVSAVVLEADEQYEEHGLTPPPPPAPGGAPVPEFETWLMVALGLGVVVLVRAVRGR
ncbi:MAG: hypothetical protein AAF628_25030 [Planctomycetota bacterium]